MTANDQRLAKKVKNHEGFEIEKLDHMGVEETEVDGVRVREDNLDANVGYGSDKQGQHKFSYASVVAKDSHRHDQSKEESFLNLDEVVVLDEDCIITEFVEFLTIKFSDRVHDQIDYGMKNVITVRLLGRNIGYGTLVNRLHALWRPLGEMQLIYLENNYFLVQFEDSRDYAMGTV
ncbi:hypothetical protein V6N11_008058 [Hibiscus sabdariffa]|uniref:DUF4283 domain-containing protein n=1 Tax=Hibiscus sabdariffa TaxID=183260 RepID=A0ABR2PZP6_9ROSI